MIIRDYRHDDMYHIHRIAALSLDQEYAPEMFDHFRSQWPSGQIVACGYDDVPVGFISSVMTDRSSARIMMFAVDPEHRSCGVGAKMLNAFRQKALMQGLRNIVLEVRVSNVAAISFYRKRGFVPCGILERFYTDGGDAMSMMAPAQLNI